MQVLTFFVYLVFLVVFSVDSRLRLLKVRIEFGYPDHLAIHPFF